MEACDNGSDEGRYIKGLIELEMNDLGSAMRTFTSLTRDSDEYVSAVLEAKALTARALLKIKFSDYKSASEDLDKIKDNFEKEGIDGDIDSETLYMNKAFCYYKIDKTKNACMCWSKAGEKGNLAAYNFIKLYCNTPEEKKITAKDLLKNNNSELSVETRKW
jgi:tetratricopeptide (TPR) repeat protein